VWTYVYDFRGRMVTAVEKTSGGTTLESVTYTYDALDNRIGMDENGTQTWTLYNGGTPIMDFNSSGSLTMRYLWGPTGIVARQTSGGTVSWYLADALGTVRDLINNSGAIIDHVDFSAFGTVLGETSPTSGDRFTGFAELERDTVTGLNLAVVREENPGTGRWDSQDPSGFGAGDPNLYRYVSNAATVSSDPTGLFQDPLNSRITGSSRPGPYYPPPPAPDVPLTPAQQQYINDLIQSLEKMNTQSGLPKADRQILQQILDALKKATFLFRPNGGHDLFAAHPGGKNQIVLGPQFFWCDAATQIKTILHEGYHLKYEYNKTDGALMPWNKPKEYPGRSPATPDHFAEYYAEALLRWLRRTPEWNNFVYKLLQPFQDANPPPPMKKR
jgi:RHS repeat-associated protein